MGNIIRLMALLLALVATPVLYHTSSLYTNLTATETTPKTTGKRYKPVKPVVAVKHKPITKAQAIEPVVAPKPVGGCRAAIAQVWPAHLQAGAVTVMQHENTPEDPSAKGAINGDGSQDFGCFQINNKAHGSWFDFNRYADPVYNAQGALKIYNERNNWSAWYAVRGILW